MIIYSADDNENKAGKEFEGLGSLFQRPRPPVKKAPAYQWQEFALKVIKDLGIPNFKRGSVFKVCKDYDRIVIERCMNETKELANGKDRWKYFFKLVTLLPKPVPRSLPQLEVALSQVAGEVGPKTSPQVAPLPNPEDAHSSESSLSS